MNIEGKNHMFHLSTAIYSRMTAITGMESGTTILVNIVKWPAPSIWAASSRLGGSVRKAVLIMMR
ncbi:hypothetical protein D3C71_1735990 [compost metagenome]